MVVRAVNPVPIVFSYARIIPELSLLSPGIEKTLEQDLKPAKKTIKNAGFRNMSGSSAETKIRNMQLMTSLSIPRHFQFKRTKKQVKCREERDPDMLKVTAFL